MTTIFENCC